MSIKVIGLTNEFGNSSSSGGSTGPTANTRTQSIAIDEPTLTVGANANDEYSQVLSMTDYKGDGAHVSTDWKVYAATDLNMATPVWQSLVDTANLLTITPPWTEASPLETPDGVDDLVVIARFRSEYGIESRWATKKSFRVITKDANEPNDYTANPADYAGQIQVGWHIGGGIVVQTDGTTGLIMAPEDEPTTLQWKTANTNTSGTSSTTDGAANTAAMANASHPAANAAATKALHGYTDWYLPAKDQLNTIYQYVKDDIADYGFASSFYWSSTQYNTDNSWFQRFSGGNQNGTNKTNQYQVRSVRNF